jgi:glycosyltransferase involved in cell wall biosynthesis
MTSLNKPIRRPCHPALTLCADGWSVVEGSPAATSPRPAFADALWGYPGGVQSMEPKVSIAIPVYNGEAFLEHAINSVIQQDFRDIQVIICDNASNDQTQAISQLLAARHANIKYHRNSENIGAGPNFNKAFSLCTGKYFKWVAHDDWISTNYIRLCAEALDRNPDAVLAHGVTHCVDEAGHRIDPIGNELRGLQADSPVDRFCAIINGALACFEIFGVIRRDALSRTDLHRSYQGSDRALLAELALLGKFAHIPDARLYNRDHPKRSNRIFDRRERLRWQDGRLSRQASLPQWSALRHYVGLVFKHLKGVERLRALLVVARWVIRRNQLLELSLDLVSLASPRTAVWLRKSAWDVWWAFRAVVPKDWAVLCTQRGRDTRKLRNI